MREIVCFNGDFLPIEEVKVSPFNRGMMYGDGCFETIKSYSGRFLNLKAHFSRLSASLNYLNLKSPFTGIEFEKYLLELLRVNELNSYNGLIRFQCWRQGGRGYQTNNDSIQWVIRAKKLIESNTLPISLVTSTIPVIPSQALERSMKLSNGINYILASNEATKNNAQDALMLTIDGKVSETTISNIFWGQGNQVFTPSKNCDLLPGITRNLVIQELKSSEINIQEGEYKLDDLYSADYVFTTNSISEIRPVSRIDNTTFDVNHHVLKRITDLFEVLKVKRLS